MYGSTLAVDRLSLEVSDNEICVLIGPSGCGKTTTLRMINRLIEPTSGKIFVDGKDIRTINPVQLRRSIGYSIQNVGLFPHMTVGANIAIVPELLHWDKKRVQKRIEDLLNTVGLDPVHYFFKYPRELSGGEAQRVGVARALAADPPILLMDEPFGAVDALTREKLQNLLLNIQRDLHKTILLVTHDLDEAIRLSDKLAIMRSGQLIQFDTPEFILAKPANKFVYDFVGVDRALKRLSRIPVKNFIRQSFSLTADTALEKALSLCIECRWLWVVDADNRLTGWVDKNSLLNYGSVKDSMVKMSPSDMAVHASSSLREALSRSIGQGLKNIPVVDENDRLLGEVTLADIDQATSENGIIHGQT
jgi:osmoprotectant transport system ATP-binding protein